MVRHPRQVPVLHEQLDRRPIVLQQICHDVADNRTELEPVAGTGRHYHHVLVLVRPVDQKILSFCVGVVTVINFF